MRSWCKSRLAAVPLAFLAILSANAQCPEYKIVDVAICESFLDELYDVCSLDADQRVLAARLYVDYAVALQRLEKENLNRSLPTETKNTRRPGRAPDPAGVSFKKEKEESIQPPTIRDIQSHDLEDTDRLLELHRQAIDAGIAHGGGAGQLDFFAFANRARARGHNPGGLLRWLLVNRRTDYITIADEEAARRRISEHLNGPFVSSREARPAKPERRLSPDEEIVEACLRVAQQHRIEDPFRVARKAKNWTREQWDRAHASYRTTQARQWYRDDELEVDFASFGRAV